MPDRKDHDQPARIVDLEKDAVSADPKAKKTSWARIPF
jgi:hypothetical protein